MQLLVIIFDFLVKRSFAAISVCIVLIGFLIVLFSHQHIDVIWYLDMAERVVNGDRLYVDVVDMNFPMIVFLNIPVVMLHKVLTFVAANTLFDLWVFVVCLLVSLFVWSVHKQSKLMTNEKRVLFFLWLVYVFIGIGYRWGQREHFISVFIGPYIILSWERFVGVTVKRRVDVLSGLLLAAAVALKPFYALLPFVIEALFVFSHKKNPLYRLDMQVLFAFLFIYGLGIIVFMSDFLLVFSVAILTYSDYFLPLFGDFTSYFYYFFLFLVFSVMYRFLHRGSTGRVVFMLSVTSSLFLAAFIQNKAWWHQFYPFMVYANIFSALMLLHLWKILNAKDLKFVGFLATGFGILFTTGMLLINSLSSTFLYERGIQSDVYLTEAKELINNSLQRGEGVYLLSYSMNPEYLLISLSNGYSVSRFNALWMLPTLLIKDVEYYPRSDKYAMVERYMFDAVLEDLKEKEPKLLMVSTEESKNRLLSGNIDLLSYFSRDIKIREVLSLYEELPEVSDNFVFLVRKE